MLHQAELSTLDSKAVGIIARANSDFLWKEEMTGWIPIYSLLYCLDSRRDLEELLISYMFIDVA